MSKCVICGINFDLCCCFEMERGSKFKHILTKLQHITETDNGLNDIKESLKSFVREIEVVEVFENLNIDSLLTYDHRIHNEDKISMKYLETCDNINIKNFKAINTIGDGNCLYNSMLFYIKDKNITIYELRVRNIFCMIKQWDIFESLYENILGPLIEHIKNATIYGNYSELYELVSFCNIFNVNIQSVYPKIMNPRQNEMPQWFSHNKVYKSINANNNTETNTIFIMWTHIQDENTARSTNIYNSWSPNHFVPLLPNKQTETNSTIVNILIDSHPKEEHFNENIMVNSKDKIDGKNIENINILGKRKYLENEMVIQSEKFKLNERERTKKRRLNESVDQSFIRKKLDKERTRKRRANEDIVETELRRQKDYERVKKKRFNNDIHKIRCRKEETKQIKCKWPIVTPFDTKKKLLKNFIEKMSKEKLSQKICSVCNCIEYVTKLHNVKIEDIPNFESLKLKNKIVSTVIDQSDPSINEVILNTIKKGKINIL